MAKTKSERKVINSLNDGFLRGKHDDEIYWDLGDGELKDEGLKRNNSTMMMNRAGMFTNMDYLLSLAFHSDAGE
jgi:hypothetical protein